jgi:hypothetical protein
VSSCRPPQPMFVAVIFDSSYVVTVHSFPAKWRIWSVISYNAPEMEAWQQPLQWQRPRSTIRSCRFFYGLMKSNLGEMVSSCTRTSASQWRGVGQAAVRRFSIQPRRLLQAPRIRSRCITCCLRMNWHILSVLWQVATDKSRTSDKVTYALSSELWQVAADSVLWSHGRHGFLPKL